MLRLAGVFIFLQAAFLPAVNLTAPEKKAIRREMVEMDIAVRNLTSIIAIADKKMLDDSLQRLAVWQIKDHPELGKTFRQVLSAWEANGAIKYGRQIQAEARSLQGYVSGHGKFSASDWARISNGFSKILAGCQGCHEITRKDPQ